MNNTDWNAYPPVLVRHCLREILRQKRFSNKRNFIEMRKMFAHFGDGRITENIIFTQNFGILNFLPYSGSFQIDVDDNYIIMPHAQRLHVGTFGERIIFPGILR